MAGEAAVYFADKTRQTDESIGRASTARIPVPNIQSHSRFYPDYPEDWIDVTEEASEDYLLPTPVANVPSRTIYFVTDAKGPTLRNAPPGVRHSVMALRDINTIHGIKDLVLAQNRDVHVLAIKKP